MRKRTDKAELWDFPPASANAGVKQPQAVSQLSHNHLDAMLLEFWDQPNEKQLNIRLPAGAKKMIERLARRKTVGVSTLVRMWVIESLRREAIQG